jgi:type II secretory ATPase GspE/PulE/Tfp pilus assembly ATPase PilB-like protein
LTFAKGLRSLVRQDPDIIMVGEIRDQETANIAVNAAMTGHLLLSTLHANNAATAMPRLLDMDVQPFLLASSLNIIIAQRLVRRICRRCKVKLTLAADDLDRISRQIPIRQLLPKKFHKEWPVHKGKGCAACGDSGYAGRIGIYEVLDIDDEIRAMVMDRKSADIIERAAIAKGMSTMLQDGLRKVSEGITTIDEVVRVMSEA